MNYKFERPGSGAVFIPIVYFLIHLLISKLSYEYQKHSVVV